MTETTASDSRTLPRRLRPAAVILLALATASTVLLVTISHSLYLEYGDTSATDMQLAARSLRDWAIGIILVVALSASAIAVARGSRGGRAMTVTAGIAVVVALVGVPSGAVLGVHQKFERYPDVPLCDVGFDSGPAVPVVQAAQSAFGDLDHPGPFSGGGSSGVDGCSTQLMVDDHVDVPAAYADTLADTGWEVTQNAPGLITATREGYEFEASEDQNGTWWVWIGPTGRNPPPTQGEEGTTNP